jgi:hypothetical protein
MRKHPLVALSALALSACHPSYRIALHLPPPPKAAQEPCNPAPIPLRTLTSADLELIVRQQDAALYACEAKRRLLIESWPEVN